jgi:hypothetical protein
VIDCSRCGDFSVSRKLIDDEVLLLQDPKQRALASHIIRKMQAPGTRPKLTEEFFHTLRTRSLPRPAELMDNFIVLVAEETDGIPGKKVQLPWADPKVLATVGAMQPSDIEWIVNNLFDDKLVGLVGGKPHLNIFYGNLTASGWQRFEDLKRAHISSKFAFFARKFDNPELNEVFDKCLCKAVRQTGYELRTATQRAGLVDAIIEDEIRRCRFLISDLSDENAGAYWEAGFAEGLGKPVIYICRVDEGELVKKIHFDTNHRHTIRWDLSALDQTATKLKAVIRNTLLQDAIQTD